MYSELREILTDENEARGVRRSLGSVYTPRALSEWVALQLSRHITSDWASVVDPACGDGALLTAIAKHRKRLQLIGLDVDPHAIRRAKESLGARATFMVSDSLIPTVDFDLAEAATFLGLEPADGVIANPPWGASLRTSAHELVSAGYQLASGQFDSYDVFTELSLALLRPSGVAALILPDSLFMPEHRPLRALLLRHQILLVGRLGEGWFPDVFRGCVVVLVRKCAPPPGHAVRCLRLDHESRGRVMSGELTLRQAEKALSHEVPQSRFSDNEGLRFDIDVREHERSLVSRLGNGSMEWDRWLVSGRGVELSKDGRVQICPTCGAAAPERRLLSDFACAACGTVTSPAACRTEQIVQPLDVAPADWEPLITGEDVTRYFCEPQRAIRTGVRGINYKSPAVFRERKLLVRKTGLGLKAAIDESQSFTSQVVFHFYARPNTEAPPFLLDYVLGVLCSRTMLAYHLKRLGEIEWRSHPYVTQMILTALPIPQIEPSSWRWRQAQRIADVVQTMRSRRELDHELDVNIENLVAGAFELSSADCGWVRRVIESAQQLEPIRSVRLSDWTEFRPLRFDD